MVESTEEVVRAYAIAKFTAEVKKSKYPQKQDTGLLHFAHISFLKLLQPLSHQSKYTTTSLTVSS